MTNLPSRVRALSLVAAFGLLTVANADAKRDRPIRSRASEYATSRPDESSPRSWTATAHKRVILFVKKQVYRKGTPNGLPRPNFKPTVESLYAALEVLAKSDRDYQGHRATAMHDIGSAILHLQPIKPGVTPPNPALTYTANGPTPGSKPTTTQAASDGYLQTSLKALKKIELHLSISSVNAQQGRALAAVEKAMKELETALALKQP